MKRIDFEHHFLTPGMLAAFAKRTSGARYDPATTQLMLCDGLGPRNDTLYYDITDLSEKRLAVMDRYGIDTAVLSSSPVTESLAGSEAVALCRSINDTVARTVRDFPGRFLGTAALPVGDVAAAADEMTRCVEELGFAVWHTHSNYGPNGHLDNAAYRPLLARAAKLGMAVYLHPTIPLDSRYRESGLAFAGAGLGFTVDSMTTAMKLVISGLFDEHPKLTVLMGHLAETLPFLLDRMDNRFGYFRDEHLQNSQPISHYFKSRNILVTTSGNMSREAFDCTRRVLGLDGILFATDYPYENLDEVKAFFDGLDLTEAEKGQIFSGNAERYVLGKH